MKNKIVIVSLCLVATLSVIANLYMCSHNKQLAKDLEGYSRFGMPLTDIQGMRTHVDTWNEIGPCYFTKRKIDDKYGYAFNLYDRNGIRVITDRDLKMIDQWIKR